MPAAAPLRPGLIVVQSSHSQHCTKTFYNQSIICFNTKENIESSFARCGSSIDQFVTCLDHFAHCAMQCSQNSPPQGKPYSFNYSILDEDTGVTHSRDETSDHEGVVRGSYEVILHSLHNRLTVKPPQPQENAPCRVSALRGVIHKSRCC